MGADSEWLAAHEPGCLYASTGCTCRADRACCVCGEVCTYDGLGHVHPSGLGIGSCVAARLAARLRAVEAERDTLLALVDDACASDDLTVLRDWQTSRLLKETQQ